MPTLFDNIGIDLAYSPSKLEDFKIMIDKSIATGLRFGISWLSVVALSVSCVTVHHGRPGSLESGKLRVSCARPNQLTDRFASVSCTFENPTDDWLKVKIASLEITNGKSKVVKTPLSPERTGSFLAAYKFIQEMQDVNTRTILSGLVILGAAASMSGSRTTSNAGLGAALGAGSVAIAKSEMDVVEAAQYPQFGGSHILGPEVEIPSGLFIRRSAIFEIDKVSPRVTTKICFTVPNSDCTEFQFYDESTPKSLK